MYMFCLFIGKPSNEDCKRFCEIHHAEITIVPDGIQKGYLMEIDFDKLEFRITQMKDKLLNTINRKIDSYYQEFSIEILI
ncbi:1237_t:CDS:1, partial [Diversispora eburnea]